MRTTYWLINDEGNPNAQMIESAIGAFLWSFGFRHSFELRHSSFVIETMFRHLLLSARLSNFAYGPD